MCIGLHTKLCSRLCKNSFQLFFLSCFSLLGNSRILRVSDTTISFVSNVLQQYLGSNLKLKMKSVIGIFLGNRTWREIFYANNATSEFWLDALSENFIRQSKINIFKLFDDNITLTFYFHSFIWFPVCTKHTKLIK